ncbi:CoA-binding protein [Allopusillimonas soli]|uniref:Acetate--CoA ligase family protein n=1 Tax=Allopusillimonas soli TaxID=659016 RepID=A0A853FFR0_9BURK|nr:acetate--CoA ligase family protein [Allopusillimonas soli]NYT38727.1 acetate--CoA ligase family protein [Allopusillimonas soli]TEA71802.1 CoA-binding protein [Allopusillimonas soli]
MEVAAKVEQIKAGLGSDIVEPLIDQAWIEAALRPDSIAVIGASDNPDKVGGRPIKYMRCLSYTGRLYPINPGRTEVQGLKAYSALADLPEVPDMAIVCVPGAAAVEAVQNCASVGVRVCVVISSGFGELGTQGNTLQERMLQLAQDHGMRLIGPNTQGLVNFGSACIASFATLIGEVEVMDGPVAIVSQSGAMSMVPYLALRNAGIGVRYAHATGNEADLTVADFALAVAKDPSIQLILLYMESIADPGTLALAAKEARRRGVSVLALKAGTTHLGQAAASSHTGAIATEDKVIDAFFKQQGILRVRDMRELVSSARLLLAPMKPRGSRIIAISNSGAACVMAADSAERHHLDMVALSDHTKAGLSHILPAFASSTNPIDLTAALLTKGSLLGEVLSVIAQDDTADALFISLPMSGKGYDAPAFAQSVAAFSKATNRPVVLACPLAATRQVFEQADVVTFEHDEDAMQALGHVAKQRELQEVAGRLYDIVGHDRASNDSRAATMGTRFLSEFDSLKTLEVVGIPTVRSVVCTNPSELQGALEQVTAPWVMKACSPKLPHKSELGLVQVDIATPQDAASAYRQLMARAKDLGVHVDGIIVAPMLNAQRELMIGARWDRDFGAVVVVGDGGKYIEAMPDVVTMLYPFDAGYVIDQVQALRMAPLFKGARGDPALPLDRIASMVVDLGKWVHQAGGKVSSVDINPLMVGPGPQIVAVDALLELSVPSS